MVWIAVGLLAFSAVFIAINTAGGRWDMHRWRWFPPAPKDYPATVTAQRYGETADNLQVLLLAVPRGPGLSTIEHGFSGAVQLILDESPFMVFTNGFVLTLFLPFLLPLLSLSFATEALGGDREANSLVWLLTRPMSRPAIYLAKFVALLPWSLLLNIGGFALLCSLAGWQGRLALRLFWPAVVYATFAFSALFFLMGASLRRPAIVAIVYAFFLETILGNMPGYLKRVSINFYAKCMMYESAEAYGIQPDRPNVFLAVDATTAAVVLVTLTVLLLVAGTAIFSRAQYQDAA
jgi:ABC-2 type transport system permease protein